MIETAENTMETFNYILREKYPDQFMDVPLYDTHIFYNSVLKADLLWDNSSMLEYCPTEYNHTRVKRAVSVLCVKGQHFLGQLSNWVQPYTGQESCKCVLC